MSKGSKRKGAKYQARIFKAISNEHRQPAPEPVRNTDYLTMTDDQIDAVYWHHGKADRTRMKKEAATERARIRVREIMEQEKEIKS